MSKIVYLFNPSSRVFAGTCEAQESPLEPGEFITPEHCTDTPPPAFETGQWAFLDANGEWIVRGAPTPTDADRLAADIDRYRLAVRQHMSAIARSSPERFNSISEAKSFVGTDNPLSVVSAAFQMWAAQVQTASNASLDAVAAGKDSLPTLADHIESLPAWEHP